MHLMQLQVIGGKVIVKTLTQGTKFVTLDAVERELSDKELMICNEKEAMCIGECHLGDLNQA